MEAKIFVTPFKTGTTSMGKALELLNYNVLKHSPSMFSDMEYGLIFMANDLIKMYKSFNDIPESIKTEICSLFTDLLWDRMLEYDCATDYPMGHEGVHPFIKKLIFPEAKFIFLERDEESFVNSVKQHELVTKNPESKIRIFWQYPLLSHTFAWGNYQAWRANYVELQKTFPDDVLFMNIKEGWEPLLKFLNITDAKDLPEFPWENKSKK